MSDNIRSYFSDYDVESMKKEKKRLKEYAPGSAPRRANNLDDDLSDVPSYEQQREDKK